MSPRQPVRMLALAVSSLRRNPVRSGLTFLTLVLGYASVLVTVATVEGGRHALHHDLEQLGPDVIAVLEPIRPRLFEALGASRTAPIDHAAVAALRAGLADDARAVIPFRMELGSLRDLGRAPTYLLTTPGFAGILPDGLLAGRFLEPGERFGPETSIVLDEALAHDLELDPRSLIGRSLDLRRGGQPFQGTVVGVLRDPISLRRQMETFEGGLSLARSVSSRRLEFKNIYIPLDGTGEQPSGALVRVRDLDDTDRIAARIEELLAARGIEVWLHVQRDWAAFLIERVDRFSAVAHFFWVVDLLVVLLLNATIASVALEERAREFAIRRIEGASVAGVVLPVGLEALLLALLGLPLGWLLADAIFVSAVQPVLLWSPVLPIPLAVLTGAALLAVAALSHLAPARRVARRHPARVLAAHAL